MKSHLLLMESVHLPKIILFLLQFSREFTSFCFPLLLLLIIKYSKFFLKKKFIQLGSLPFCLWIIWLDLNYLLFDFDFRFLFPALGGLLYGYDIGSTSCATISIEVAIVKFRNNLRLYNHFHIVLYLFDLLLFVCLFVQSPTLSGISWYGLSSVEIGLIVSF